MSSMPPIAPHHVMDHHHIPSASTVDSNAPPQFNLSQFPDIQLDRLSLPSSMTTNSNTHSQHRGVEPSFSNLHSFPIADPRSVHPVTAPPPLHPAHPAMLSQSTTQSLQPYGTTMGTDHFTRCIPSVSSTSNTTVSSMATTIPHPVHPANPGNPGNMINRPHGQHHGQQHHPQTPSPTLFTPTTTGRSRKRAISEMKVCGHRFIPSDSKGIQFAIATSNPIFCTVTSVQI